MDMVEFFAGRAGIETKIPDIMEMRIRDMDDDFLDEIDGRLDNIVTNLIRMVVIIPVDHVGFLIIADDAAFSDAGTADIAYIVRDASVDVRTVIFVLEIIIEVDKIEMMRMVVFEDIGMKRSVDHDKEIIPGPRRKRKNKAIRKAVS